MVAPLDGITVLDLTRLLPGPFATQLLRNLGADVIKIEDPALGDYMRSVPPKVGGVSYSFLMVNRGKRSLAVDLKRPEGQEILHRLAARADVIVEQFRPGVPARLGADYSTLSQINPRLVYCSFSGYGETGPAMNRPGHDITFQAHAGILGVTGGRDGRPVIITLNWDIAVDNASYTHSQFTLDYGYEKARSLDGDADRRRPKRFRILKLHGSLNWWVCQSDECQTLWYRAGEKDVPRHWEEAEARLCRECGNKLLPLMVPPTAQKFEQAQVAISPMRAIWKEAREAIRNCQDLAIVGYSFPPTDVQFRMFLLEALSRNDHLRKVVVSSPKIGARRQRFEDVYDDAFAESPQREKLHFVYKRFEDWVDSGMPFEV